jgi:hypothetical protein
MTRPETPSRLRLIQQAQLDRVAQLIQVQIGGVDFQVGQIGDRAKQGGFILNRLGQRAIGVAQRMATTGFGETLEQGFFVGVQIQDIALDVLGPNFFKQFGKARQMTRQVARIDRYGDQRLRQLGVNQCAFGQFRQQACRQVVDAVIAVVLKDIQSRTFTRAGTAADDDQAHD